MPNASPDATGDDRRLAIERLCTLFDDLLAHDGHGGLELRVRWLKRGLKEVLITSGKEYRYVVRVR